MLMAFGACQNKPYTETNFPGKAVVYDFGDVGSGERLTRVFRLTNTTRQPIKFLNVTKNCSCFQAELSGKSAGPGEFVDLKCTVDASKDGENTFHIIVSAVGPEEDTVVTKEFNLQAQATRKVRVNPQRLFLSSSPGEAESKKNIQFIYSKDEYAVASLTPATNTILNARVSANSVRSACIEVSVKKPSAEDKFEVLEINLTSPDGKLHVYPVPVQISR